MVTYFRFPEGPSTQYLRTLIPNTIPFMVFGTRVLKYWVLRPTGVPLSAIRYQPETVLLALQAAAAATSGRSRAARKAQNGAGGFHQIIVYYVILYSIIVYS